MGPCLLVDISELGREVRGLASVQFSRSVVSDSSRLQGLQPTRLLHPWDFPSKSTGVGCHFLLQCIKWKVKVRSLSRVGLFETPVDCSLPGSSIHGISQARVLEWTAFAFSTMIYEILVILDSRSTMIDPKEPLNSESPLLCFKQRKIMLYTQKAHGSGPTHPKACSVV